MHRHLLQNHVFPDRRSAGTELARALKHYRGRSDLLVLALPRGGVPVAEEVARFLGAPLDVFIVRKLGVPGQPELAMGAIASGGVRAINDEIVQALHISPAALDSAADREYREVARRERTYRGDRPPLNVAGRTVIVIDDGIATGATMRAGVRALRKLEPARLIIAVPHAPVDTCESLAPEVDEIVCLEMPEPYIAVGRWYQDFPQLTDQQVRNILDQFRN
jgi:predicted phosphoribosyltransferase